MTNETYLSVREVAAKTGTVTETVRRWIHEGRLPAVLLQIGPKGAYRIKVADLETYLSGPPVLR